MCSSWCERKPVKSNVLPSRSQRSTIQTTKMPTVPSLNAPIRQSNLCSDFAASASKDLASQVQATRR